MAERLNSTAAALLGFLHEGPMTGWDLVELAGRRIGDFWSVTRSQVYRELAAMAAAGLIEEQPPGPRERRPYGLTAAGRDAFARWAASEPGLETIRFPLLLRLAFGRHADPRLLARWLADHRRVHAERLAGYESVASSPGGEEPYARATLAFGLTYERAVLGWFDEVAALLGDQIA